MVSSLNTEAMAEVSEDTKLRDEPTDARPPSSDPMLVVHEQVEAVHSTTQQSHHALHDDLDDILLGMKFASLAITDDTPKTLQKIGKSNPWQVEALKIITGSKEEAHRPISDILKDHFDLTLDCHLDFNGLSPSGHFLDTQGYIAHNDTMIVLSYRCTTSAFDWLTNFTTTSSEWEIEEDLEQGHSGFCSDLEGLCCGTRKPRVHTGFYNNFLVSLPDAKRYIEPLLGSDKPPRKLFVTGHSLGAGIATLAFCYFLFEYDWNMIPQSLHHVSAGSPRACGSAMAELVRERIREFPSTVHVYRLVKGKDVVASVPPSAFRFRHISDPVVIANDGSITLTKADCIVEETEQDQEELRKLIHCIQPDRDDVLDGDGDEDSSARGSKGDRTKYDKFVSRIPASLRDHMPDFYLRPLIRAKSGHVVRSSLLSETTGESKEMESVFDAGEGLQTSGHAVLIFHKS